MYNLSFTKALDGKSFQKLGHTSGAFVMELFDWRPAYAKGRPVLCFHLYEAGKSYPTIVSNISYNERVEALAQLISEVNPKLQSFGYQLKP